MFHYGYTLKLKEDDVPAIWERAVEEDAHDVRHARRDGWAPHQRTLSLPTS
jgi:hypothetical protein